MRHSCTLPRIVFSSCLADLAVGAFSCWIGVWWLMGRHCASDQASRIHVLCGVLVCYDCVCSVLFPSVLFFSALFLFQCDAQTCKSVPIATACEQRSHTSWLSKSLCN